MRKTKRVQSKRVKYWDVIVNKIIKAGFSVGWVSAFDDDGRTVWIVDVPRDGKRLATNFRHVRSPENYLRKCRHCHKLRGR